MLEAFVTNFILIYPGLMQCFQTEFAENRLGIQKIQMTAGYKILGAEILSNEELYCKTTQFSE